MLSANHHKAVLYNTDRSHVNYCWFCLCVFQDEVDSQNPVLRDNHQLHEEVKNWLKDQKVQEIFMQGKLFFCIVYLSLLLIVAEYFCHSISSNSRDGNQLQ